MVQNASANIVLKSNLGIYVFPILSSVRFLRYIDFTIFQITLKLDSELTVSLLYQPAAWQSVAETKWKLKKGRRVLRVCNNLSENFKPALFRLVCFKSCMHINSSWPEIPLMPPNELWPVSTCTQDLCRYPEENGPASLAVVGSGSLGSGKLGGGATIPSTNAQLVRSKSLCYGPWVTCPVVYLTSRVHLLTGQRCLVV